MTTTTVELPAAGIWKLDPVHAEVGFVGRHFMLTKVRGRFTEVDATVTIGDDPAATQVEATIEMASVNSGHPDRDDHLRSADLFDVTRWPQARFVSTAIDWDGASGALTGDLTIKDVTRPVTLDVELLGLAQDPWGNDRAVFTGRGRIDREDWGLTWNMLLEAGGLLVSKEIELAIELELIRQA